MASPRESERVAMGTTPASACRAAQRRAKRSLRQIEALLAAHAKRRTVTWGHVGLVKIVADELAGLLKSMQRRNSR